MNLKRFKEYARMTFRANAFKLIVITLIFIICMAIVPVIDGVLTSFFPTFKFVFKLINFAYWIFVQSILVVGMIRVAIYAKKDCELNYKILFTPFERREYIFNVEVMAKAYWPVAAYFAFDALIDFVDTIVSSFDMLSGGFVHYMLLLGYLIFTIWYLLQYGMVKFIIADPNAKHAGKIGVVFKRADVMLTKRKEEYFDLLISFLPWFILSIVTLGIGLLFAIPYLFISCAIYYDALDSIKI